MNGCRRCLSRGAALLLGVFVCAVMTPEFVWARPTSGPRILKMQRRLQERFVSQPSRPTVRRRLAKFTDQEIVRRYDEVVSVYWMAPRHGLPPDAVLQFEYLHEKTARPQVLQISYPFKVSGRRKAEFVVPAEAIEAAGPVKAWRVALIQRGQVLVERRSQTWRTRK